MANVHRETESHLQLVARGTTATISMSAQPWFSTGADSGIDTTDIHVPSLRHIGGVVVESLVEVEVLRRLARIEVLAKCMWAPPPREILAPA